MVRFRHGFEIGHFTPRRASVVPTYFFWLQAGGYPIADSGQGKPDGNLEYRTISTEQARRKSVMPTRHLTDRGRPKKTLHCAPMLPPGKIRTEHTTEWRPIHRATTKSPAVRVSVGIETWLRSGQFEPAGYFCLGLPGSENSLGLSDGKKISSSEPVAF
jgi:hypothetical protein